jgi:hypothetical protein
MEELKNRINQQWDEGMREGKASRGTQINVWGAQEHITLSSLQEMGVSVRP